MEQSRISDTIMVECGFDLSHIDQGIEHYKLNDDAGIKQFKAIVTAQLTTDQDKMMKKCTMPYEMVA